MKPCEESCCKCGSTSIKRKFLKKDGGYSFNQQENPQDLTDISSLVVHSQGYGLVYCRVLNDMILNQCYVCNYTWGSLPL